MDADRGTTWTLRPGGERDADAVVRLNLEGFESYRAFAPPGWHPPSHEVERQWVGERLGEDGVWSLLAEDGGEPVGHVAFMPAALARRTSDEPGLAHFWLLFVSPSHWGTGLASELHARALAAAADRGFSSMRLYTPAGQARARRFYEREGWTLAGQAEMNAEFGLELVEYRRPLDGAAASAG